MTPAISMRAALEDPNLLGTALEGPTWKVWRTILIAAMNEPLSKDEWPIFTQVTGRKNSGSERVDELWCVVGRRGGKSRAMSVLACYIAAFCDFSDKLVKGETGVVLLIAPDIRQAKVSLGYCLGVIESTPIMHKLLSSSTADTITLKSGIRIEVRSSSFRRIRGVTCIAVLADECAFWLSDDSANPDIEILNAARPALATTGGPLICISSPHARRGALWETFKRHYGENGDPAILVAKGTSREFNPSLDQAVVDRALERDHAAASAEFLAQFRTDIEGFLTREAVEACVDVGTRERPHARSNAYVAFVDPSGGSSDSMTLAIAHKEGSTTVLDVIRERRPPFSPEAVVDEFAALMRSYRISTVIGDRYGGEWVAEAFRKNSVNYEPSTRSKSELYSDLLPLINSRGCALLDNDRLVMQLTLLERRTARGGKDSIDHPRDMHDDIANAVAGALVTGHTAPGVKNFYRKLDYGPVGIY